MIANPCQAAAGLLAQRRKALAAKKSSRGMETVEMALTLPVLVLLLLGVLDVSRLFFTEITLQQAMREAGRFGVTGQHLPDPKNAAITQSRIASIRQMVQTAAVGVTVNSSDIIVSSVNGGLNNAGGPGDTFTLSLTYKFVFATPLIGKFFNNGSQTFVARTTFRNEPFPPSDAL